MAMKWEEIQEGVYVRWVADRYLRSWNICGKVVEADVVEVNEEEGIRITKVAILGFDNMAVNRVSLSTVMEECTAVSRAEAVGYANRVLAAARKPLIDMEADLELQKIKVTELAEKISKI
jgi:formylmethanofuran dehydrogenase subunit B